MIMRTRCPNCRVVYRVDTEQLKARKGNVRCGRCKTPFNALDNIVRRHSIASATKIAESKPEDKPSVLETEKAKLSLPFIAETNVSDTPRVDESVHESVEVIVIPEIPDDDSEQAAQQNETIIEETPHPKETAHVEKSNNNEIPASLSAKVNLSEKASSDQNLDELPQPKQRPKGIPRKNVKKVSQQFPDDIVPETRNVPKLKRVKENKKKHASIHLNHDLEHMEEDQPVISWSERSLFSLGADISPKKKITYWTLCIILGILLAGQWIFYSRGEISQHNPRLRPILSTYSKLFGSSVPLSRNSDEIKLVDSKMYHDPKHENYKILYIILGNKALYDQDFPALEVILTDTFGMRVIKRVFTPSEYLPTQHKDLTTFVAGAEINLYLKIKIDHPDVKGYQLEPFYP